MTKGRDMYQYDINADLDLSRSAVDAMCLMTWKEK
jgi:hypothetical protein